MSNVGAGIPTTAKVAGAYCEATPTWLTVGRTSAQLSGPTASLPPPHDSRSTSALAPEGGAGTVARQPVAWPAAGKARRASAPPMGYTATTEVVLGAEGLFAELARLCRGAQTET